MKAFCFLLSILCTSCVDLRFDPMEYNNYISIKDQIVNVNASCGTSSIIPNLDKLHTELEHQLDYSSHKKNHSEYTKSISIINNMVIDMQNRYKTNKSVSIGYCKIKTNDILVGTNIIIREIGNL